MRVKTSPQFVIDPGNRWSGLSSLITRSRVASSVSSKADRGARLRSVTLRLSQRRSQASLRNNEFRQSWNDSPLYATKNVERLRAFFRFCHQAGWIKHNPALLVKPPKVTQTPTLPFSRDEMKRIVAACHAYRSRCVIPGSALATQYGCRRARWRAGRCSSAAKTGQPVLDEQQRCVANRCSVLACAANSDC